MLLSAEFGIGVYNMATETMNFKSVYHCLDDIMKCLQQDEFSEMSEVQKLMSVFKQNYKPEDVNKQVKPLHPFIVVEGLDGSGKTTCVKKLRSKLNGTNLSTPPKCLLLLREHFDGLPNELRRAYYSLGNYIVGMEVERQLQFSPVIMDRFWHSTAAYAISDEVRSRNLQLPPLDDPLYKWPSDLIKPDIVILLETSEKIRIDRLKCRNLTSTAEEQLLTQESLFRENVTEAYKRMHGVPVAKINANLYFNKTMKQIMSAVEHLIKTI